MSAQAQMAFAGEMPVNLFERGLVFSTGREGRVDLVEAHKWFNIAAAKGDRMAAERREEVAGDMSREEIALALKGAREWISRH